LAIGFVMERSSVAGKGKASAAGTPSVGAAALP
jgi:hypothetical protein